MDERRDLTLADVAVPLPPRCGVGAGSPARTCANEKVLAANRANAARSTGPRTRAGKAAVARNALRHGLSLSVLADPALSAEVAALARRIAGEDASEARREAALRIAEAQVDILRIRGVRNQIMVEGFAAAGDITARLMRLDRYERRALARRKSAIRAFDSLGRPAAAPRRDDPWAAVAAAARLSAFWRNKPDCGKRRDPWIAVAAAAGLRGLVRRSAKGEGGFWQNKPDCGRTRLAPGPSGRPPVSARVGLDAAGREQRLHAKARARDQGEKPTPLPLREIDVSACGLRRADHVRPRDGAKRDKHRSLRPPEEQQCQTEPGRRRCRGPPDVRLGYPRRDDGASGRRAGQTRVRRIDDRLDSHEGVS